MQPRSEPLLWLQCLALGAIPLELLLIRLVLAGADPGPVPGVERFLIWGVGVLAPAVALWRRPADWGSLLLVRQPLASRNSDQLRISASHSALSSRIAVVIAAVILLPVLWWLDDSAVLASEFSPVSGQSRLATLLLVSPLMALIVWQVQQLVQASTQLLGSTATVTPADSGFRADAVATQRTSLGLQLLNLPALEWPEPAPPPRTPESETDQSKSEVVEESAEAVSVVSPNETNPTSDQEANEAIAAQPSEPESDETIPETGTEEESSAIQEATTEESEDAEAESETLESIEMRAQAEAVSSVEADEKDSTSGQGANEAIAAQPSEPEADDTMPANFTEEESSAIQETTAEVSDDAEAESETLEPVDLGAYDNESEGIGADDADVEGEANANPPASPESTVAAAASVPVKPEQPGEEQESTALDPEIRQLDSAAGGSTESHREQAEPSGGKESEPDQPSEPTPGGL